MEVFDKPLSSPTLLFLVSALFLFSKGGMRGASSTIFSLVFLSLFVPLSLTRVGCLSIVVD